MKRLLLLLVFAVMALGIMAQSDKAESAFNTYVYNEEYQVYLDLCLDRTSSVWCRDISVPCVTLASGL